MSGKANRKSLKLSPFQKWQIKKYKFYPVSLRKWTFTTPEKRIWHFMQIVSREDNLHEMTNPVFSEKIRKMFQYVACWKFYPGSSFQSIVSLMSSIVVKMLIVLVSTITNSQVFLLKSVSSFCKCKSYPHFFSKNIGIYAIFDNQQFNDMLTNDTVSFGQLVPEC